MADKPAKYRVIGSRSVSGVKPGGTYTDDGTLNVPALVKARHLAPLATGDVVGQAPAPLAGSETLRPNRRGGNG